MENDIKVKAKFQAYAGALTQYTHESSSTRTPMRFSVYVPESVSEENPAHVLFYLAGLTCTDENFAQKATIAFKTASENNLVIVLPDTSPRGAGCPHDTETWDFGEGAGFYLNATAPEYSNHYNMYAYITEELWSIVSNQVLTPRQLTNKRSIFGHSMGGYGALHLYLKSGLYTSCSAFAPIADPVNCPWGQKAFSGYLGDSETARQEVWPLYNPTYLIANTTNFPHDTPILIDQGLDDVFLHKNQLLPQNLLAAAQSAQVPVQYREHPHFDHGYFFIHTFVVDHILHHIAQLNKP